MKVAHVRLPIWRLLAVAASVALLAGAAVAFPSFRDWDYWGLFAWAVLYGEGLLLIGARGVAPGKAAKIAATIVVCGLSVIVFVTFFNPPMGVLVALVIGWLALLAVAFFKDSLGRVVDRMYDRGPIMIGEPELPPLVYDPNWSRPTKARADRFRDAHWIGFVFLLPHVVMLVGHEALGMTDAFLGAQTPWDRLSADYNLTTALVGLVGSLAFVVSAVALPVVNDRGIRWIVPKLVFLVLYWLILLLICSWLSILHSSL
jgi:hypothetical protein